MFVYWLDWSWKWFIIIIVLLNIEIILWNFEIIKKVVLLLTWTLFECIRICNIYDCLIKISSLKVYDSCRFNEQFSLFYRFRRYTILYSYIRTFLALIILAKYTYEDIFIVAALVKENHLTPGSTLTEKLYNGENSCVWHLESWANGHLAIV